MKIAPVAEIKAKFSSYIEQCGEGPIIVTKNGRPAAVLLGITDEEELERLVLAYTPKFMALLNSASNRITKGGGMKHTKFWRTVGKKQK